MEEKQTFGIDDMTTAVYDVLKEDENTPASAKDITKKAIKAVLQAEHELIMGAVSGGDKVTYVGFGTFESRERKARKGRNPQTGKVIDIDATTVPAFKAGKSFREAVKGE